MFLIVSQLFLLCFTKKLAGLGERPRNRSTIRFLRGPPQRNRCAVRYNEENRAKIRAANGAENDPNAGRIFGYFVLIFGYFRANLWLFCRPARSTTATATPHGQEIGFFLPRKIQKLKKS